VVVLIGWYRESGMKTRILVVEDNPGDVALLRWALEAAKVDFELTVIEDGAEAMMLAQQRGKYAGAEVPDLAILDLNLPRNDGIEVLQAMRASRLFADVTVAILSSSASPRERERLDEFGVDRYILKPADLDEFRQIGFAVRDLIEESRLRRWSVRG
jgi:two-component system response regulator